MFRYACFLLCLQISSLSLAQRYEITHLGGVVNTVGSETGAVVIDDSVMLFSSHGVGLHDVMQLHQVFVDTMGRVGASRRSSNNSPCQRINVGGSSRQHRQTHSGNVAYDKRNDRLFFTRCESDDTGAVQCAIWVTRRSGGRWQRPHRVGGDVNRSGSTSTHPAVAYQADGTTLLYFASDRDGGLGGLDIWYTVLRGDLSGRCVNLGAPVNSDADELTPFYDTLTRMLYFSSDRNGGMGGYDVYCSAGARDSWRIPLPLPAPVNSSYNDLYFTVGTTCGCWGFLASNREDSMFEVDSSCCNDLYRWRLLPAETRLEEDTLTAHYDRQPMLQPSIPAASTTNRSAVTHPIVLYFHNDEPDAGSWSDTTAEAYFQTYNQYMFLRRDYLSHAVDDTAQEAVRRFFDEVRDGCDRFEMLMTYLLDDLDAGRHVQLSLRGYASTPHSSDYNDRLSARRIACVVNQLYQWRGGALSSYLHDGSLRVVMLPQGSRSATASGRGDDPVYDIGMARDRRVEIVGYQIVRP